MINALFCISNKGYRKRNNEITPVQSEMYYRNTNTAKAIQFISVVRNETGIRPFNLMVNQMYQYSVNPQATSDIRFTALILVSRASSRN